MQQVNLYVAELRPQVQILPARQVLLLLVGLVVLLALAQGVVFWQAQQAAAAQSQAEARLTAVRQDLARLEDALTTRVVDDQLQAQTLQLAQRLDTTRSLIQALQPDLAQRAGLSPVLEALARQHQPGLWLSSIELAPKAGLLALRGSVLHADKLPLYLQRLQTEPAFSGLQINVMQLQVASLREGAARQSPAGSEPGLRFYVSTQEQAP